MKVAVGSDFHIEFGAYKFDDTEADVLVLGGDVCIASKFKSKFDKFFSDASARFKDVIYIMGNHEHYDGDFTKSEGIMRDKLSKYANIHFLEKQTITLDDVTFIGGTMWTDMNRRDDLTLFHVRELMSDFQIITNSSTTVTKKFPVYKKNKDGTFFRDENGSVVFDKYKSKEEFAKFSPNDSVDEFDKFFGYLNAVVAGKTDEKFFVCTHHSPSLMSVAPQYKHDYLMNGAFASRLEEWILDHPQIKVWSHGHTHNNSDYMLCDTRIICNPRGYVGYEAVSENFKLKVIEV